MNTFKELEYYPIFANHVPVITYLRRVARNNATYYKKFKVAKKFNNVNNNQLIFTFDKTTYNGFDGLVIDFNNSTMWKSIEFLYENTPRISITKEQYNTLCFENVNFNPSKVNISTVFFRQNYGEIFYLKKNQEFKLRITLEPEFNNSININFNGCIPDTLESDRFETNCFEYECYTYVSQKFELLANQQEHFINIERNIPISEIAVTFDCKDLNLIESVYMDNIELIPQENFWYNSCVDKIFSQCNYFYPVDWKIKFVTKPHNNIKGCINFCIPNFIQNQDKGRLYYSLTKQPSIDELPKSPFSKLKENKYAEGYWYNITKNKPNKCNIFGYDSTIDDSILPFPIQEENPDIIFHDKLKEISKYFSYTSYLGSSFDRLGNKNMGGGEYSFEINNITYVFPEGYFIYLKDYNVHPSVEFRNIIETLYEDMKNYNLEQEKYNKLNKICRCM